MLKPSNTKRKPPEELVSIAKQQIYEILMDVRGVDFVMLCSTDGFEIETANKKDVKNHGKLAAVSSSIVAMVNAFISEIQLSGCQSITLDADNGKAILTSIPSKNYPMIILTVTAKDILLGQLLHAVKKSSDVIVAADQKLSIDHN